MNAPRPEHRIVYDTAGWGGWPRLTCETMTCGKTLLRKPFHGDAQWAALKAAFESEHSAPAVVAGAPSGGSSSGGSSTP